MGKRLRLVTGLPYAGKTTFGRYLSKTCGHPFLEVDARLPRYAEILCATPETRPLIRTVQAHPENFDLGNLLGTYVLTLEAEEVLRTLGYNTGVVVDSFGFSSRVNRSYFMGLVRRRAAVDTEVYWMDTDFDTCLERWSKDRARLDQMHPRYALTENLLRQMAAAASPPTEDEKLDKIFFVRGISPEEYEISEKS